MFPTRLPHESNAPSITFALRSGEGHRAMRQEELLGLQWEEVDFECGELYVIKFPVLQWHGA
jgi:hypothetical protein